jgi:indole-3-glycerol phosphate synthase
VRSVAALGDVPVLRKDFLFDRASMEQTAAAGATAVLLTVAILGADKLATLHADARACGLETLVETHNADELAAVIDSGLVPDLLGINNRDIRIGEIDSGDVQLTERIAGRVPPDWLVLSESAIADADDARRARDAGADAILVGTAILRARDPAAKIDELIGVGWRTPARR